MSMMGANGGLSNGKLEMATAVPDEVLAGQTFYAGDKDIKTGSMPNNGAWSTTLTPGNSVTILQGYHNGGGNVSVRANASAVLYNANLTHSQSTTQAVSGYTMYLAFTVTAPERGTGSAISANKGSIQNNFLITSDDYDGGHREFGRCALITGLKEEDSVSITIKSTSSTNYSSRVVIVGFK